MSKRAPKQALTQDSPGARDYFPYLFGLLMALAALPVLLHAVLPQQDAPAHIAIGSTLARHGEPGWEQTFTWRLGLRPYVTYYALHLGLTKLLGGFAAHRVLMLAYVLALPLSLLALLRSLRIQRWAVLPSFLLIYGDAYLIGFTNHLLALPVFFAALGLAVETARRGGWLRRAGLLLLGLALLLTHPLVAALWVVCAGLLVVAERPGWASAGGALLALAPTVALLAYLRPPARALQGTLSLDAGLKLEYLARTPMLFATAVTPQAVYLLAPLLIALLADAVVHLLRGGRDGRALPWALLALTGMCLAGFALLPFGMGATVWLDARFAWFAWAFLFVLLGRHLAATRLGKLTAALLGVLSLVLVERGHARFETELAPLWRLLDRAPAHRRVLDLSTKPASDAIQPFYSKDGAIPCFSLYAHIGAYYHAKLGGVSPFMTFHPTLPWIPLGLHDARYGRQFLVSDPFTPTRMLAGLPYTRDGFDLVLLRSDASDATQAGRWIERFATPIERAGPFALYALEPRP